MSVRAVLGTSRRKKGISWNVDTDEWKVDYWNREDITFVLFSLRCALLGFRFSSKCDVPMRKFPAKHELTYIIS
jgi:hypothetical protein